MLNKVQLIGRLGRDPEHTVTPRGAAIVKFSIATNSKRGEEEITVWHRCVAFNKTAELIMALVKKGTLLYIEGKLQYGSYEGKDGHKVNTTDILVDTFQLLSPRDTSAAAPAQVATLAQSDSHDDLPF